MTPALDLAPGFDEPVHGAQRTFRAVLQALANPGTPVSLAGIAAPPDGLNSALAAVALTLLDHEARAYLCPSVSTEPIRRYVAFHTGAPVVGEVGEADFVLAGNPGDLPEIANLKTGTAEYPDRSATLLIGVTGFGGGNSVTLTGPGIETDIEFAAAELDMDFWVAARRNHARFPVGVDFVFCGPGSVAGLPRSTAIAV